MDLSTEYLGLKLRSPLVPSASPVSVEISNIKRMEDAGASAIVLYSLFEEQLVQDRWELHENLTRGTESTPEALTYFPEPDEFHLGPEEYLNHIRRAKEAVKIPIIASLNGTTVGGWTDYAVLIEQAGADALELNIYYIPADPTVTAEQVEKVYVDILKSIKAVVKIPIAVKLVPFFSKVGNVAQRLVEAGADGLVLFNRFYQPDIDLEDLEVRPNILLSTPQALRLPLRWIAMLHGRINTSLAATSGIHGAYDALKLLMAGADITQLCSVLLRHGIPHIRFIEKSMTEWLEQHEYTSIRQLKGSMSQKNYANPTEFERAWYMKSLQSYRVK